MKDILIRDARESDILMIKKLMEELIEVMENTKGIDIGMISKNYQNLLNDSNSHFLVVEKEGTIIGFANFTTRKTLLHSGPSGLIDELVIAKEYRGKGIGQQLINAVIQKCKQLGCCEVEVSTEKTNIKAIEFYKKCGFEERGIIFELDLYA